MRRLFTLTFLAALGFCFSPSQRVAAQITGFTQPYIQDSFDTHCLLPSHRDIWAHIVAQGSIPPGDSVTVNFNFGDATDTTYKIAAAASMYAYGAHAYTYNGTFTTRIIFTATTGVADTLYTNPATISDTCADVYGYVYRDNNADCIYNAGDIPFKFEMVKITNQTTLAVVYAWTDSNGIYHVELPSGYSYRIEKANLYGYTPSCPPLGYQVVTVVTGTYFESLAYVCNPATNIDLSVTASSWSYRPGFNSTMFVYGTSPNACEPVNTTVTLTLDPHLSYITTWYGMPPTTVVGNVLTWTVTGIDQLHPFISDLYLHCDSTATLGDTLCSTVIIDTPNAPHVDTNTANNGYTVCAPVTNAVDPNEKEVMPKGIGTPGYIQLNTMLSYVVNFQNTGNDTAINVTVKDTLDGNVDMASIHFISSSHPVTISTLPGNVLIFRFDNIMLPDSGHNQAASHGYVMYSVKPKNSLTPLSTIHNNASIYFDFNPAVRTNTTLNTISPVNVQRITRGNLSASVYPNPANNQLMIEMSGKFNVNVYDLLGRPVITQSGEDKLIINTVNTPQGMYLIRLSKNGEEMTTRINILH